MRSPGNVRYCDCDGGVAAIQKGHGGRCHVFMQVGTESTPIAADRGQHAYRRNAPESVVTEMFDQHLVALQRYAVSMLGGDWHKAEDIVQEAAIRAWLQAKERPDKDLHLQAWLKTVVRNLVIDEHRARKARPQTADYIQEEDIPEADPSDHVLARHVIANAMTDLSVHHREVLWFVYYLHSTTTQASEALGIATGTVKSRSYYALRALKAALAARGVSI